MNFRLPRSIPPRFCSRFKPLRRKSIGRRSIQAFTYTGGGLQDGVALNLENIHDHLAQSIFVFGRRIVNIQMPELHDLFPAEHKQLANKGGWVRMFTA